jgi:Mg2+ and Co2+ transporter CorA
MPSPTVRTFLFDADGSDQEVHLKDLGNQGLADQKLLWVDVDLRDTQDVPDLSSALPIEEESLDRVKSPPTRPHIEDFDEYFHLNVRSLQGSSEGDGPIEIQCLVGKAWMVTTHRQGVDLIESFLVPMRSETELGRLEGPVFLAIVLDWFLSGYFLAIEDLETRLDALDESVIARGSNEVSEERLFTHVVALRREITVLRQTLSSHREIFATLSQPEFDKVAKADSADRYRVLSERLDKAIAAAENTREMAMDSLNIVMARTAERTNAIVKILTVISAVLLPALVIAAVLGMNFRAPFFERSGLFWVTVAAMVALGIAIVGFARLRKWF